MATTLQPDRPAAFEPEMAGRVGTSTATPGWDLATERRIDDGKTLATPIGWFSLALGLGELIAPEWIGEYLGMEDRAELIRLYGLREVASGLGVLGNRRPSGWMWGRVAGDALDLATLATGLTDDNPHRDRVMGAMLAVAGVAALDVMCARQLSQDRIQH